MTAISEPVAPEGEITIDRGSRSSEGYRKKPIQDFQEEKPIEPNQDVLFLIYQPIGIASS
jgi:hypothetical protein